MVKLFKITAAISLALTIFPVLNSFAAETSPVLSVPSVSSPVYEVELSRWAIFNNGTNAAETTVGFNKALVWAKENGYTTFKVPAGTYLIDANSPINMVSNMIFSLDANTVLQKETNGLTGYTLLFVGPGINNVTLQGGTYRGDKDTHDYSIKGTHEGGYGIITSGAENITIDGITAVQFTGDGLAIGSMGSLIDDLYAKDFKSGSVNAEGKLIPDSTKIRLEKMPIKHKLFNIQRTFQFIHQSNFPKEAFGYTAYFYKTDGTYISNLDTKKINKPVGWGLVDIPNEASYMNVVFDTPAVESNAYLEYWMQGISKNVVVKNSEFAFNRRQGITIGGAQEVLIENNKIHDMKGTAPQSGIDVEAGYNLNNNITIRNNRFYNNQAYDLILYDGRNAVVEGNYFGSKSIGLAISEPFKYATVTNNHFDGAKIYAYNYAAFNSNKMNDSLAAFLGDNLVIDGMEFTDTLVNLASATPFGIDASNITVNNTKKMHTPFGVNKNPIHLKNITITGQAALDSFGGNATNGSIFDNLQVLDYTRSQLPRGTYNDCQFKAAPAAANDSNGIAVNNSGEYEFNQCAFTSQRGGFEVNSVHGMPDSVILKNSTVEVLGDNSSGVSIQAGKKIVIENNTINTGSFPYDTLAAVIINGYWEKAKPADVFDVTIRGNTIETKSEANGISTIYAGIDAPAYLIESNTLINSTLNLKKNDILK